MRSKLLFIVLFMLWLNNSFAQKGFSLEYGIKPGISFISGDWYVENHSNSDYIKLDKTTNFSFETGVNALYNFKENMGISMGLYYASQGQSYQDFSYNSFSGTILYKGTYDNSLKYIKIPLKFNFSFHLEETSYFIGYAGFYLGFLSGYKMSYNLNYTNTYSTNNYSYITDGISITETSNGNIYNYTLNNKAISSTDIGLILGAGMQKKLNDKLSLLLILDLQFGFNDIKNIQTEYYSNSSSSSHLYYNSSDATRLDSHKNTVIGLMFGIRRSL